MQQREVVLFWFRRDLRFNDNHGLLRAFEREKPVLPLFIFDRDILERLEDVRDARVAFIHQVLSEMNQEIQSLGTSLRVEVGRPLEVFKRLTKEFAISSVYANHDYEPAAVARDERVRSFLREQGIDFFTYKDQVIFEKSEIVKGDGKPYLVYTPYSRKWKETLKELGSLANFRSEKRIGQFVKEKWPLPELTSFGFEPVSMIFPEKKISISLLKKYGQCRDYPAQDCTSRLGVHFRFGTLSVRQAVKKALKYSEVWLNELIWREFFMMILYHFPFTVERAFHPEYDEIEWRNDKAEFAAWCVGRTGFALVDAGMRQLNQTGYMHNRVRMLTASFLSKHLLVDWRWGESYFAKKLLDYEQSSNVGNWQWAVGSGCDAAPYFRIFSPDRQVQRFDKDHLYIKRWVREFNTEDYIDPIVDHKMARERALKVFKQAVKK